MRYPQLENWLKQLKQAWESKDPRAAAELCAKNILYYETPFTEPLKSREEVMEIWKEVPQTQKDIHFSYEIISTSDDIGVIHWSAIFTRIPSKEKAHLDGIFTVKLNKDNLCVEFHQWWNSKF